jgi:hypothetical protein
MPAILSVRFCTIGIISMALISIAAAAAAQQGISHENDDTRFLPAVPDAQVGGGLHTGSNVPFELPDYVPR